MLVSTSAVTRRNWRERAAKSSQFVPLVRQALRAPPLLRPTIVGGALSIGLYLVTAASYKSYFLVPMVGMAVGAILAIVARTSEAKQAAPR